MTNPAVEAGLIAGTAALPAGAAITRLVIANAHGHRPTLGFAATAITTGIPGMITAWAISRGDPVWLLLLPMTVLGLAAAVVDVGERRLPDALIQPLLLTTTAALVTVAAYQHDATGAMRSLGTAAVITAVALVIKLLRSAAIGWGDIKLIPSTGMVLGWADVALFGVLLWAVGIGISALLTSGRRDHDVVPYGPALIVGTLAAVVAG